MKTLIGIAAGFVAGILLAPKSGRENREMIKQESNNVKAQAEDRLAELLEQGKTKYNEMLNNLKVQDEKKASKISKTRNNVAVSTQ